MSPDAKTPATTTKECPFSFSAPKCEKKSPQPAFGRPDQNITDTDSQQYPQRTTPTTDPNQCNMASSPFTFALTGKTSLCTSSLTASNGARSAEHHSNGRSCLLSRACEKLKTSSPRLLKKLGDCHRPNINEMSPSTTSPVAEQIVLPQELSQRLDNNHGHGNLNFPQLHQHHQQQHQQPSHPLCRPRSASMILMDIRPFLAFSRRHISGAFNVNCATRFSCRRLREGKLSLVDLITSEEGKLEFQRRLQDGKEIVVYDEDTQVVDNLPNNHPTFLVYRALRKEGANVRLLKGGIKEFETHSEGLCVSDLTNVNTSSPSTSPSVINDGEEPPSPTTDSEYILRSGSGICPTEGIPMTQVLPHVYFGNEVDAANLDELRLHGISYVLNVTNAVPCFQEGESAMRYLRIPVRDHGLIDLGKYFQVAYEFIEEARRRDARVLVHCHAGISRSSTIVIAYVMKYMNMSMSTAYQFVKSKRPIIAPNLGFVGQLVEFEQYLNKINKTGGCRITDSPTTCAKQLHHSRPGTPCSMELDAAV